MSLIALNWVTTYCVLQTRKQTLSSLHFITSESMDTECPSDFRKINQPKAFAEILWSVLGNR